MVHVIFNGRRGVRSRGSQYLDQGLLPDPSVGVDQAPETFDVFGSALAAGNFDGAGRDDLAIGSPGETADDGAPVAATGMVIVARGSRGGIRTGGGGAAWFREHFASGNLTQSGGFGTGLAAANVGYSREDDVLAGAPGARVGGGPPAGAVAVLYGGPGGIADAHSVSQGVAGVEDFPETEDRFGHALGAGRFDGKGPADLAIGVPGESIAAPTLGRRARRGEPGPPPIQGAGAVAILRGTKPGISFEGDRLLHQGAGGLAGTPQLFDRFGVALSGPGSGATDD